MDEDEWRGTALERPTNGVEESERGLWQEQAQLPLRERDAMWWAGVALPTAILGLVAVGGVVLIALIFVG